MIVTHCSSPAGSSDDDVYIASTGAYIITHTHSLPSLNFIFKTAWETRLNYVVESVEEWLKIQRTWMQLEPIFRSADMIRQMPVEAGAFRRINAMWRSHMEDVEENRNVLDVCEPGRRVRKSFPIFTTKLTRFYAYFNFMFVRTTTPFNFLPLRCESASRMRTENSKRSRRSSQTISK